MESLCFDLFQVLERQGETLKEMLTAAHDHNQALRLNDMVALQENTDREEKIAERLKAQDRQREHLQTTLEKKLDLPGDTPLSKLLSHMPESHRTNLSQLAAELRNIAREIAGLVELNDVLTRRAMHFNEQLLRLLKPGHNSTYQPDGKSTFPVGRSSSLINKTV